MITEESLSPVLLSLPARLVLPDDAPPSDSPKAPEEVPAIVFAEEGISDETELDDEAREELPDVSSPLQLTANITEIITTPAIVIFIMRFMVSSFLFSNFANVGSKNAFHCVHKLSLFYYKT